MKFGETAQKEDISPPFPHCFPNADCGAIVLLLWAKKTTQANKKVQTLPIMDPQHHITGHQPVSLFANRFPIF